MSQSDDENRPRERVLRHGPRRLGDADLVALLLGTGRSGQTAIDLARALLDRHGDLGGLAVARADVLSDFAGMGPAKAAALVAAFELGRRTSEQAEAVPIRRAEDVVAVARREARGVRRDELLLFVADAACRVRRTVGVGSGPLAPAHPYVGRVVTAVQAHHGAGFAVARLSTEAAAVATPADVAIAKRLRAAALYMEAGFLDYVVVTDTTWCSATTGVPIDEPSGLLPPPVTGSSVVPYDIRAGP